MGVDLTTTDPAEPGLTARTQCVLTLPTGSTYSIHAGCNTVYDLDMFVSGNFELCYAAGLLGGNELGGVQPSQSSCQLG
jgi:hypothetical protein